MKLKNLPHTIKSSNSYLIIISILVLLTFTMGFLFWKIGYIKLPYSLKEKINIKDLKNLDLANQNAYSKVNIKNFEQTGFKKIIAKANKGMSLPRIYFSKLSIDLEKYETSKKKQLFISIMLPIILRENELVLQERELMKIAFLKNNIKKIEYFSRKYRIKNFKNINFNSLSYLEISKIKEQLSNKINKIPTSMVLAQSAIESGWGSSRFAKEGNALFGEWTWNSNIGLKPKGNLSANYAVKSFLNISESVRSYMLNLNSHYAYEKMRLYRSAVLNTGITLSGYKMANYLDKYAEIGLDYTLKVKDMIRSNKFDKFDNSDLENNNDHHLIIN